MAYRWLGVLALVAACSIGCENNGTGNRFVGLGGSGGVAGGGGGAGAGGTGGVGGSGGTVVDCVTSPLCGACPFTPLCDTTVDCSVGFTCIELGCDTLDGDPIKKCVFAGGGACDADHMCPPGRDCIEVPGEGERCVKTTPGCSTDADCIVGFLCEEGSCFDRRVPCILDADCPKSHFCHREDATSFCRRVHVGCNDESDCAGIAPRCDDIDEDGTTECAGAFNPNVPPVQACLNSACSDPTPVCEVGDDSGFTSCGQYGLCTDTLDCADGFECVGLWLDGRSECVPVGGSCDHIADCSEREVCASPRTGEPPSCQRGVQL